MHQESLKHHIKHLEDAHEKLEKDLHTLEKNHMLDTLEAHEKKKKKLHIKDEIVRCKKKLETLH